MKNTEIKFYASAPHECGYLPDQEATSLFADPEFPMSNNYYSHLINLGFRRSGEYVYRPHCALCSACIPARIPVKDFQPSRSQKRVLKKNADMVVRPAARNFSPEQFELYKKYIHARHEGGGMDNPDITKFASFIDSSWCNTIHYEFRLNDKLVAVAVTDILINGLSAFYTYYDPDYAQWGLGNYAILWQIDAARKSNLKYVYLGYWIEQCKKMSYKSRFHPLETYREGVWQRV